MEGALLLCPQLEIRFSIPLPPSSEPPEALGELPNTGIAIPRELLKGRASRGVDGPGRNSPFQLTMEGALSCVDDFRFSSPIPLPPSPEPPISGVFLGIRSTERPSQTL